LLVDTNANASHAQLIATKFPWFLDTYKSYPYGIQRADALRYFVLYEYGGVYIVSTSLYVCLYL